MDFENATLWNSGTVVDLPPKAFELLRHFVNHPGRLQTKDRLLEAVWQRRYLSDSVLKGCINTLRVALGDSSKESTYIETVPRYGYRFIAPVRWLTTEDVATSDWPDVSAIAFTSKSPVCEDHRVGRDAELAKLQALWQDALAGRRQMVFVHGEVGIGKTTLIEMFLERANKLPMGVLRARCVERYGECEALMPLLESLERRCRAVGGGGLVDMLRRHAPMCLMQMPSLLSPEDHGRLRQDVLGSTKGRMLREAVDLVEAISQRIPLVLIMEDLHWGDVATLDLLALLGRRADPARLLVLATFRPVDARISGHRILQVRQDLLAQSLCTDIRVGCLGFEQIRAYLVARLSPENFAEMLPAFMHARTEGHPLFMVSLTNQVFDRQPQHQSVNQWLLAWPGSPFDVDIPDNLRAMIESQIDRLVERERAILETASVIGIRWSAGLVAFLLGEDVGEVETCCEHLVRLSNLLQDAGASEDGDAVGMYVFNHALYIDVLYGRLPAAFKLRLHRRIGAALETSRTTKPSISAAELAHHFEQGQDFDGALRYLREAAEQALYRSANREAGSYVDRALAILDRQSLSLVDRQAASLELLLLRGTIRRAMNDMLGAIEDYSAARQIAERTGQRAKEVRALLELGRVMFWVDRRGCLDLANEAVALSHDLDDELLRMQMLGSCGGWKIHLQGWDDVAARHCEAAMDAVRSSGNPQQLNSRLALQATLEIYRARYPLAVDAAREGREVAMQVGDAQQHMVCCSLSIIALLHVGDWGRARKEIDQALEMAHRNENELGIAVFTLEQAWLHEWALDFDGALRLCESAMHGIGDRQEPYTTYLGLLRTGSVSLKLGDLPRAFDCFRRVDQRLDTDAGLIDWNMRLMLHQGWAGYWLRRGDFERALQYTDTLIKLASLPRDHAYLALGHDLSARIALEKGNVGEAGARIGQAFEHIGQTEAPHVLWQVYRTALDICRVSVDRAQAERYEAGLADVVIRLASGLEVEDPLRGRLIAQPEILVMSC